MTTATLITSKQARLEFSRAMSEKDEDNRRRELALEEKHFRELARKSKINVENMAHDVSANRVNEGGDGNAPGPSQRESSTSKASEAVAPSGSIFCEY